MKQVSEEIAAQILAEPETASINGLAKKYGVSWEKVKNVRNGSASASESEPAKPTETKAHYDTVIAEIEAQIALYEQTLTTVKMLRELAD